MSLSLLSPLGHANIEITAEEQNGDVVFTFSGSIRTADFTSSPGGPVSGIISPSSSAIQIATTSGSETLTNFGGSVATAPANFGTGGAAIASDQTGNSFTVNTLSFAVPTAYQSGNPLSGSLTFEGRSFATLGMETSGSPYVWTLDNGETVTLTLEAAPAMPPSATTESASSIGPERATLNATVNPNGKATSVTFEYGESDSYGDSANATLDPDDGDEASEVSVEISNLSPNTTYHFRVCATNSDGTSYGSDQTFTTSPASTREELTWPSSNGYAHPLKNDGTSTVSVAREAQFFDPGYGTNTSEPNNLGRDHIGIDFSANQVDGVPVYAIDRGEILDFQIRVDYNDVVYVRHRTGNGTAFIAIYGHCKILSNVWSRGDVIEQGEQLGNIPSGMQGPHLHFGINQNEELDAFLGRNLDLNPDSSFGWGRVPINTDRDLA
ncbi:MAG: peptidoglycan DD-metalloendopeptidase family protein, partial [Verrucomicrobiota bacterium]